MLMDHYWANKGHVFGECMSRPDLDLMYVNVPKNASSWTKPNLQDWGWEFYNYRTDNLYHKHTMVVLRDPVERWISGIAEYFALYRPETTEAELTQDLAMDLIFDRVTFDDHTERQVYFIDGLDINRCTFFKCDATYRERFADYLRSQGVKNKYDRYDYQHVSSEQPPRGYFKEIFSRLVNQNSKYLNQLKQHFADDYKLIESVKFYGT